MKCMQADQRIIGGAEEVGADGQTFVVDKVMPLASGEGQERWTQSQGQKPKQAKGAVLRAAQRGDRRMDRQAAGEQADRSKDGEFENFFRRGAGETFADIENISNNENGEDGRFRRNQQNMPTWPL